MTSRFLIIAFILLNFLIVKSQDKIEITATYTTENIVIDGQLNEKIWQQAQINNQFIQNFPNDTILAVSKTNVQLVYNDKYLFVAVTCFDELPGKYIVQSFRRDFENNGNDMMAIMICPTGDKQNGYCFSVSPYNVQREGTIEEGGLAGVTTAWETKWKSATQIGKAQWQVELAIPFASMRFVKNANWLVNIARNDYKRNEKSTWVPVKKNINLASLSNTKPLKFTNKGPIPKNNVAIIPFVFNQNEINYDKSNRLISKWNGGVDAKLGLKSGLNLDLTLNPDFSHIEVDRQVTNLTRFSVFYPEKRTFFIENGDLFSRFGFSRIRPFFSRTVGLNEAGQPIPVIYGAKLSGKLDEKTRIGILSTHTNESADKEFIGKNYLVAAAQINTIGRSNLGMLLVNQAEFKGLDYKSKFNTIIGADYNLSSLNNKWRGKLFYHQLLSDKKLKNANASALWLNYNNVKWDVQYNHEFVNKNYQSPMGFIYRNNIIRFEHSINYNLYPKNGKIFVHGPTAYLDWYLNPNWKTTDYSLRFGYKLSFINSSNLTVNSYKNYMYLTSDFDASGKNYKVKYKEGSSFDYYNVNINYTSNFRKKLRYNATLDYGTYYTGKKLSAIADLNYRFPPFASIGASFEINKIDLPKPYNATILYLIGSKLDITFTPTLYWATFLQYNTQQNNFNINSRFQWRFAPVSDLFLVYTDNYLADYLKVKNRFIILKLNYWISR
jgi:hypothetical protein